jgi:acetyl-CoA synthetase
MNMPQELQTTVRTWETAAQKLPWFKQWHMPLVWNPPFAHWFAGGELNASYACLDAHINNELADHTALIWESESGERAQYTYQELHTRVNACAHFLQQLGIAQGERIIVYMPMIPETIITLLALARLGAVHVVVFSGFSSMALKDRIEDVGAQFIVTADHTLRRGKKINLKKIVDEAVSGKGDIKKVIVVDRTGDKACLTQAHDVIYQETQGTRAPAVAVESNHPLFILYTSGTTGKPKGIVHSTGGYLTHVYTSFEHTFKPTATDVYWCTADVGWITGHSYVIYAPLMHGLTVFIHEGAPDYPDAGVWWSLIERHKVTKLYTSPTALRMAIKAGDVWPNKYDLSSLKILGTVGEPINPEVWKWYYTVIGKERCPIMDTWWQTETGGFMITPAAEADRTRLKPGSAGKPMPGIDADVVADDGTPVPANTKGYLVIKQPWPGMCIGIYNDNERFIQTYWSKFPGSYYTGDYAYKDQYGNFWLLGRADEVLNIAGHRIGTAEIESAALNHPLIAEAAAIGIADAIKGEQAVLFVTLKQGVLQSPAMNDEVRQTIRTHIGPFVAPAHIYYIKQLPKTRSGKIMRRLLKGILDGKSLGDVSTLEDQASLEEIKVMYEAVQRELQQTA